jgi:hypothetical protein
MLINKSRRNDPFKKHQKTRLLVLLGWLQE